MFFSVATHYLINDKQLMTSVTLGLSTDLAHLLTPTLPCSALQWESSFCSRARTPRGHCTTRRVPSHTCWPWCHPTWPCSGSTTLHRSAPHSLHPAAKGRVKSAAALVRNTYLLICGKVVSIGRKEEYSSFSSLNSY